MHTYLSVAVVLLVVLAVTRCTQGRKLGKQR